MKRILLITLLIMNVLALAAKDFVVVIDPGHGGKDPGAVGRTSKEKNINLKVALALGKLISDNCKDVKVVYTRQTDVFIELNERANIANRNKVDLFISIHTNATAAKTTSISGTETYLLGMHRTADNLAVAKRENSVILLETNNEEKYEGFDPKSSESYIIFELMQDQYIEQSHDLAKRIQSQFSSTAKRNNRGVYQAGFLVLRETSMPSVLVELGYINNANEEAYLNSQAGVDALSRSLYNAFVDYKKNN